MSTIERKSIPCEIKSVGDDGSFELYALAFNNVDRGDDVIARGAVTNVDELVKDGVGLLNHEMNRLPVAYAESAVQDEIGLLIRGKFHNHPEAQALRSVVRERMAAGKSAQCSIGYIVDDAAFENRGGRTIRILKSIRVYEWSFVNVAMNPAAGVISAKSADHEEEQSLDANEKSLLAKLWQRWGGETKKGRPISAANHATLADHASGMADTLANMVEQHKSLKACHKEMGDKIEAFKAFVDQHKPSDPDEDGDDDSSEEGDADHDAAGKKKAADPPPATKTLAQRREAAARRLAVMLSLDS